jgi:hypothetical protein
MGNFIASALSIFVPLTTHLVVLPYMYHPERLGGIPWKPPNPIMLMLVKFISNIAMIIALGTLSGMMTTKQKCKKYDTAKSFSSSKWLVLGFIIGHVVLQLLRNIKSVPLANLSWMPYADWIVTGTIVSIFVLSLGAIGNTKLRKSVCSAGRGVIVGTPYEREQIELERSAQLKSEAQKRAQQRAKKERLSKLPARAYYKKYGSKAIGDICHSNGVLKCLVLKNSQPTWTTDVNHISCKPRPWQSSCRVGTYNRDLEE